MSEIHLQSLFILTLLIVMIVLHKRMGYSIINPFSLFIYTGMTFLGVAFLGLEDAMTPLKSLTWLVIGTSWLSYILGLATVELSPINPDNSIKRPRLFIFNNYNWKVHLVMSYLTFGLSLIAFIYTYFLLGTTVLLSGRAGDLLHGELILPYYIIYFFYGCILPCSLALIGAFKWNPHTRLRRVFQLTFIVFFIISFNFWGTRLFLLLLFTIYLGIRTFCGKEFSLKLILLFPFGAFTFFIVVAYFQTGTIINHLILPYQYIANSIWNLDYAFDLVNHGGGHPITYGHNLLSGIGYMLPNGFWGSIHEAYGFDSIFNESIQKVRHLNTVSYQWYIYKDFGWFGIILGSYFWGLGMAWLWKKNLFDPRPIYVILYILLISGIVLSSMISFWASSITIYLIFGTQFSVWLATLFGQREKDSLS